VNRIFVRGLGAVSPAGWGVPALREALRRGEPLPLRVLERPTWPKPLLVREVPAPTSRPAFLAHPRLRRSTVIGQYAAGAAVEAIGAAGMVAGARVGLVVCLQSGCVQYSCRFFEEVLKDAATASPLLFPETVHAAPASHIAAVVPEVARATTLVGDPGTFLQGLATAADWVREGAVDLGLVVGAEETDWHHSEAAWHLDHGLVLGSGAGAVVLGCEPGLSPVAALTAVTDSFPYEAGQNRHWAAQGMRRSLPAGAADELLCEGTLELGRVDRPEREAWTDWPGPRLRPKTVLGDGLVAGAAWQVVAACDAVASGNCMACNVSVVGCNQQAIGARVERA